MTIPYRVAKRMLDRFEQATRIHAVYGKIRVTVDSDAVKIRDEYGESRKALLSFLRKKLPKE